MSRPTRVLQVAASDLTVAKLVLPLIDRLQAEGYEVHAACGAGRFASDLNRKGYVVHTVPMSRSAAPLRNLRALATLYRLMARERYDVVHVHTPVAAALGRIAATLAGVPAVIYTAHGFYFHERMKPWANAVTLGVEKALGRITDLLLTQSGEDAETAIKSGICPAGRVVWISNGVDVRRFAGGPPAAEARRAFGLGDEDLVVGFVGRLVGEKGILELLEAMKIASSTLPRLVLLVAGDSSTAGDRDRRTQVLVRSFVDDPALPFRVVFTGWIDNLEVMMQAIDVFALPSYREGMPRSIIEAMAGGKPVVATDIRGCREEVVEGETGYLVPVGDSRVLARRLTEVLSDPGLARRMGEQGRLRAVARFDELDVLDRQVAAYARVISEKLPALAAARTVHAGQRD